jgi:hypothetical protein
MTDFNLYFQLGFAHITDLNGYDHILFVVALCAVYRLSDWRQVLLLVTAFTVGHSITLALATLRYVEYRTEIIEFLIPVTILLTAISNFFHQDRLDRIFDDERRSSPWLRYAMALGFGLIHGLGFSNYLRSLLGREASIVLPLFSFNLGLEIGQLLIVLAVLTTSFVLVDLFRVKKHDWKLILSGAVAGIAIILIKDSELLQF